MASDSRYGAAIHALLLAAVAELQRRGGLQGSDDMTSRELLRNARLSDGARHGLGDLVRSVEMWLFGKRPMTRDDYQRCLSSYDRLLGGAR